MRYPGCLVLFHGITLHNLFLSIIRVMEALHNTYIPMSKGFMYLTAIIDVYSRFIVSWDVNNTLDAENCLNVLKMAISKYGKPEIINSDQGCQFTSALWIDFLASDENKIQISMDGKGRAKDNIYIERFWRTVKYDYVYLRPAENGNELYAGLKAFIDRYNHKRHQGIARRIPSDLFNHIECL